MAGRAGCRTLWAGPGLLAKSDSPLSPGPCALTGRFSGRSGFREPGNHRLWWAVPGCHNRAVTAGEFGLLLRGHWRAAGLRQEELSERSGISIRMIADAEWGRTARPHARSVQLTAPALYLAGPEYAAFWAAGRGRAVTGRLLRAGRTAAANRSNRPIRTPTPTDARWRTHADTPTMPGQESVYYAKRVFDTQAAQLRILERDVGRQASQLERQQASDVGLHWWQADNVIIPAPLARRPG
jgi:transcriptional regulator with XRE-family HTH domain